MLLLLLHSRLLLMRLHAHKSSNHTCIHWQVEFYSGIVLRALGIPITM